MTFVSSRIEVLSVKIVFTVNCRYITRAQYALQFCLKRLLTFQPEIDDQICEDSMLNTFWALTNIHQTSDNRHLVISFITWKILSQNTSHTLRISNLHLLVWCTSSYQCPMRKKFQLNVVLTREIQKREVHRYCLIAPLHLVRKRKLVQELVLFSGCTKNGPANSQPWIRLTIW